MKTQFNQNQRAQREPTGNTPQLIQQRAYELFLKRGKEPSRELEDWLQAEREITKLKQRQENE